METLTIKIKVKDKIEAWKIISHLSFEQEIEEANFQSNVYKFDEKNKPKDFFKTLNKQQIELK
jgi:hypothetical protein